MQQLSEYISEIHSMTSDKICCVDGTFIRHTLLGYDRYVERLENLGPYNSVAQFVKAQIMSYVLIMGREQYICDGYYDKDILIYLISLHDNINDEDFSTDIVLCHNDLSLRNVMINDNKIVAILDWEFAGYYPADIELEMLSVVLQGAIPNKELWRNTITNVVSKKTDYKVSWYLCMLNNIFSGEEAKCPNCYKSIVKIEKRYNCDCKKMQMCNGTTCNERFLA
jgi:hypothetical protein